MHLLEVQQKMPAKLRNKAAADVSIAREQAVTSLHQLFFSLSLSLCSDTCFVWARRCPGAQAAAQQELSYGQSAFNVRF